MKKFTVLILFLTLLLPCMPTVHAESYWDFQADYLKAVEADDGDAIIACVKRLEKIYANPTTATEYSRLGVPFERAALVYEQRTMFPEANEYYKKSYACYEWLDRNGENYYDKLKCLNGLILHTAGAFEVYAEAAEPIGVPYYDAVNEPVAGTLFGSCDTHPGVQSAQLIYVQYFTEESSAYSWLFPKNCDVVELAWNVPNATYEDLIAVCAPENLEYMRRNIDWLAKQDYKILLRFGAEVDCWPDLSNYTSPEKRAQFLTAFKAAFRQIADYAHSTAPNIAMVFSPNAISHWSFDMTEFYPGDNYVDWVGMSSYNNISTAATGKVGSGTDAAYSRGVYENQILCIKHIIDAYGDRKPIMISECGFCYQNTAQTQNTDHAASALKYFYTYVNRVYPQVKAVFYFNTNYGGENYKLAGNDRVLDAYQTTVGANAAMQSTVSDTKRYYADLSRVNEQTDTLRLSAYAYYPGVTPTVAYTFDGKEICRTDVYPYECTLTGLTAGLHRFSATVTAGNTTVTRNYGIYVDEAGRTSTLVSAMEDVTPDFWGYENIAYCLHEGLFNGTALTRFSPNAPMTRAMLVTVLWRMEGKPDVSNSTPFVDVPADEWYTDAVAWAFSTGVVNGTSLTTFTPDDNITREQTAAMLCRYAEHKGLDITAASDITSRPDYDQISNYALPYLAWANYHGIINGDQNGMLNPRGNATRTEVATMLRNYRAAF